LLLDFAEPFIEIDYPLVIRFVSRLRGFALKAISPIELRLNVLSSSRGLDSRLTFSTIAPDAHGSGLLREPRVAADFAEEVEFGLRRGANFVGDENWTVMDAYCQTYR
jgi:hypothetical protein